VKNNPTINKFVRNVRNIATYAPHRVYALLLIGAAVIIPGLAILAYGPDRPTYTANAPADHITFNSITDAPGFGDERNFTWARPVNAAANNWQTDQLTVQDGQEYYLRVRVHNNAAANLNLIAQNTRVMASVPTTMDTSARIQATVSADNATPQQVWDGVTLASDKKFSVGYVPGSARYYNAVNVNDGFPIPDSVFTASGAQVGYQSMNGELPGCNEFAGALMFKVKVFTEKTPQFSVKKEVRKEGDAAWQKTIATKPGDKIEYRIGYDNIGETQQNDVIVKDTLPEKVSYTNGSTTLKNATFPNSTATADGVTSNGINIGNYTPNSNAFVYFKAVVPQEKDLACGINTLRNTAIISTQNGNKLDTADVTVTKECVDQPIYTCDMIEATKISQVEYSFNVKVTAKNATAKEVTIDFGDGQTAVRDLKSLPVKHTYAQAGQYTIVAKASFDVGGQTVKDITSQTCKTVIDTTSPTVVTTGSTSNPGAPVTPEALPSTGPAEVFAGILASAALGLGIQQWYASRKAVEAALHHQ
jgi:uncharacterized repeat protein (TIGR01451 family)